MIPLNLIYSLQSGSVRKKKDRVNLVLHAYFLCNQRMWGIFNTNMLFASRVADLLKAPHLFLNERSVKVKHPDYLKFF